MQEPESWLAHKLRERGHRVTAQRLVIYKTLRQLGHHVTAEDVLDAVADQLPSLALPTVYATLEVLEELGAVRRIATVGGTAIYDPVLERHHHLVCSRCGAVEDLVAEVDAEPAVAASLAMGFQVRSVAITIQGLCANCSAAGEA
jgi:Fe2+ or Zn2+ uptake regulation protein